VRERDLSRRSLGLDPSTMKYGGVETRRLGRGTAATVGYSKRRLGETEVGGGNLGGGGTEGECGKGYVSYLVSRRGVTFSTKFGLDPGITAYTNEAMEENQ